MAIKTSTKYIGTATTLTLTAMLLWIAFNQNFTLTASGDITCLGTPEYSELFKDYISDCQVFWNVTSINYTYYFRNKAGIELSFTPEVNDWKWYVKDGRYKSGWRPLDKSGNFTYRKGIKYQFMAFVFKEPEQTIKWSITAADVSRDPILFGINLITLKECITATTQNKIDIYRDYLYFENNTKCSDEPINKTCFKNILTNYTKREIIGNYISYINTTICEDYGFNSSGKILNWKKYGYKNCSKNVDFICCEAQHQSNGNGKCESGEGYEIFNISDLNKRTSTVSKTSKIRELVVE